MDEGVGRGYGRATTDSQRPGARSHLFMIDGKLHREGFIDRRAAAVRKLGEVQFVYLLPVVDVDRTNLVRVVGRRASVDGGNGADARRLEDDRCIDAVFRARHR